MTLAYQLSDSTIHRIVELDAPFLSAFEMLPGLTAEQLEEHRHWLEPLSLARGDVFNLCYQSHLVRTPHHLILVDSCLGNDKPRPRPEWSMKTDDAWMTGLRRAGVGVEDIDFVLCTHLHVDHVGWHTRLHNGRWVPTFPNARYLFSRTELETTQAAHAERPNIVFSDSVLPILDSGRAEIVDDDHGIGDHLRLLPTPGHTPGHVSVCVGRGRDEAVFAGDLIHVPLQLRYPELSFSRDQDPDLAARTRRAFLERYCDTDTLCCSSHFPSPSVGLISRWGDGFRFQYRDGVSTDPRR